MTLNEYQQIKVEDLSLIECQMGNPTFTWNSNTYNFIPSMTTYARQLETGGFQLEQGIKATVRTVNTDGSYVFPLNVLPQPQQKITYSIDGKQYRIDTVEADPVNVSFRMTGVCVQRGI